jgi:hypothetical protein
MRNIWTIPFNNNYYICWKDKQGKTQHRPMTDAEDRAYFTSKDPERTLNELLDNR